MALRIFLLGLPGTGKSAVVKHSKALQDFEYIVLGDFIKAIGTRVTEHSDRDEIRRQVQIDVFKSIQYESFEDLKKTLRQKDTIIDTHAMVQTQSGLLSGLTFDLLDCVRPDLFVLIESDPKDVAKRRNKDQGKSRIRDVVDVKTIALNQEMERTTAIIYSVYAKSPLLIVKNEEGKIKEAVYKLEDAIERLKASN